MDFLNSQAAAQPGLAAHYGVLGDLCQRKLWHQLADALLEFVQQPGVSDGDNLVQLYEKFVSTFEAKVNQLKLVLLASRVAAQLYPSRPFSVEELERTEAFLGRLAEKRARLGEAAFAVLYAEITSIQLKKAGTLAADPARATEAVALLDSIKARLDTAATALEELPEGEEPVVPSTVHRVSAEYYKLRGPAASFYASAMAYLAHTPLETLSQQTRAEIALDVALAALVGDGIFNFGELNAHPIMSALSGGQHAWLAQLLKAFQTGDVDAFNAVVDANRGAWDSQPALSAGAAGVKEKLALVTVMEVAARRPALERSISFAELATETRLPVDQVEWLVMRAISAQLIKASIDEVEQVVHVTYVRPRVLGTPQIAALKERVEAWRARAHETLLFVEDRAAEIFA